MSYICGPAHSNRDKLIWRTYLMAKALGYPALSKVREKLAERLGMTESGVRTVITDHSPDGCYDRLA